MYDKIKRQITKAIEFQDYIVGKITGVNIENGKIKSYEVQIGEYSENAHNVENLTDEVFTIGDIVKLEKRYGRIYIIGRAVKGVQIDKSEIIQKFTGTISAENVSYSGTISATNVKEALENIVVPGMIILWNGSQPPDGWAFCDGQDGRPLLSDYEGMKWIIKQ